MAETMYLKCIDDSDNEYFGAHLLTVGRIYKVVSFIPPDRYIPNYHYGVRSDLGEICFFSSRHFEVVSMS
jgi:hypothetical protein